LTSAVLNLDTRVQWSAVLNSKSAAGFIQKV